MELLIVKKQSTCQQTRITLNKPTSLLISLIIKTPEFEILGIDAY